VPQVPARFLGGNLGAASVCADQVSVKNRREPGAQPEDLQLDRSDWGYDVIEVASFSCVPSRRSSGSRVSTYCRRRAAWINALLLWPIEMSRDVFISYRSEDRAAAERICAGLERENISCWIAPRDIPPGGDWPSLIFEAIRSAKVFLIVLSSNSKNDAKQIAREAALADKQRLNFIVFRVENVEPPEALSFFLVNVQYLDGFGDQFDSALARLVDRARRLKKGPWGTLVADLENLEQALHSLGSLLDHPDPWKYPDLFHMVEVAAEPVCDARKVVSQLGDQSTRHELDEICTTVGMMRTAGEPTAGVGAEVMARALEEIVKKLRGKLLFRT